MNKLKLAAGALAPVFMFGCDNPPNKTGKDGYRFEKETFFRSEFPVEVILFPTEQALQAAYKTRTKATHSSSKTIAAFAVIRTNNPTCTIYMLDPKTNYQPEFIGHELVHCIYGEWHK
jgi:hypothetical protein